MYIAPPELQGFDSFRYVTLRSGITFAIYAAYDGSAIEEDMLSLKSVIESSEPISMEDRSIHNGALSRYESNRRHLVAKTPITLAKTIQTVIDMYSSADKISEWWRCYYHELAHYDKALEFGFGSPFFHIYFVDEDNAITTVFNTNPGIIPDNMTDADLKFALVEIAKAPLQLPGGKMSAGDKFVLNMN